MINTSKKIVLQGGGISTFDTFESLKGFGVFDGLSVAFAPIALEYSKEFYDDFVSDFFPYAHKMIQLGAKSAHLVFCENFDELFDYDCIILGSGKTSYLLQKLRELDFAYKLSRGKTQIVAGSGSGAIALARKGVGSKMGKEFVYHGLGIVDEFVVVGSDDDKQQRYPNALHLAEYEAKDYILKDLS